MLPVAYEVDHHVIAAQMVGISEEVHLPIRLLTLP